MAEKQGGWPLSDAKIMPDGSVILGKSPCCVEARRKAFDDVIEVVESLGFAQEEVQAMLELIREVRDSP